MEFKNTWIVQLAFLLLLASVVIATSQVHSREKHCKVWLAQSIPTDMTELRPVSGILHTGDVLQWLAGNASREGLDITAQYWQLLEGSDNPNSGDYGYFKQQLEDFGAPVGKAVYDSLVEVADKAHRLLPEFDTKSAAIATGRPNVQNRTLVVADWWGSGVIDDKVWIANKEDVYIGSANNDWKSLTQVKELGIYFTDCPAVAKRLEGFFNNFWTLTTLNASLYTQLHLGSAVAAQSLGAVWVPLPRTQDSLQTTVSEYIKMPNVQGYPYLSDPHFFPLQLNTPAWKVKGTGGASPAYVSVAPPEIASRNDQIDEQGWVDTILSVPINGTVRMNTMDWLGQSEISDTPVLWPVLMDAIAEVRVLCTSPA